jgi:enoyl-CoA hydratase
MQDEGQRNKLSEALIHDLREALERIRADATARVVILTGAGPAFSAGADLNLLQSLSEDGARAYLRRIVDLFHLVDGYEKPTIAAINGYAMGGGMELSLATDLRLISDEAVLGLPEVRLGIVPGAGGVDRLTHFIGRGRALEIAMTGRRLVAPEVVALGLASKLCGADELLEDACRLADELASMSAEALLQIKTIVRRSATVRPETARNDGLEAMVSCSQTDLFRKSVDAFRRGRSNDGHHD